MSGEELTATQVMWLAKIALAIAIMYMMSKVIPAILEYKKIKYLEVVITTKQCEKRDNKLEQTFFQRILSWIKDRKKEETEDDYLRRWMNR